MEEVTRDIIEIHAKLLDKSKDSNEIADLTRNRSSLFTEFRGKFFKLFHTTGVNPNYSQGIEDYPYVFRAEKKCDSGGAMIIKALSIIEPTNN
ncbi:hypothetical protein KAR91_57200 [Candidatus Pacearchaeota archaeon]|nr:hypothetical protein [Candidatus Pacearchaeota archaeon]